MPATRIAPGDEKLMADFVHTNARLKDGQPVG